MPYRNGRGPEGMGPMTGRGLGNCSNQAAVNNVNSNTGGNTANNTPDNGVVKNRNMNNPGGNDVFLPGRGMGMGRGCGIGRVAGFGRGAVAGRGRGMGMGRGAGSGRGRNF